MKNSDHDGSTADNDTSVKNNKRIYAAGTALASVTLLSYFTFIGNGRPFGRYISTENVLREKGEEMYHNAATFLKRNANKSKIILEWSGPNILQSTQVGCGEYQCTLTSNRSALLQSDAIIMTIGYINPADLPTLRFPWQRWIFKSHDSPANHRPPRVLNGKINWTLTYHRNSDIPFPFGFYRKRGSEDFGPFHVKGLVYNVKDSVNFTPSYESIVKTKSNGTLWIASNCAFSHRNKYIRQLRKFGLQIDIMGGCGKRDPCRREQPCLQHIFWKYKFYLAFENSNCDDYITEKVWRALDNYMLPIVMGPPIETYKEKLPPNSFIHVDNFTGPKDLVSYIKVLEHDDKIYSCYHEWRQNYEVVWTHKLWTCHLCRKLHEDFTGQSYLHIDSVWSPNMCRYPNETRKRTLKSITSNFMWSKWKLFKK